MIFFDEVPSILHMPSDFMMYYYNSHAVIDWIFHKHFVKVLINEKKMILQNKFHLIVKAEMYGEMCLIDIC